MRGWSLVSSLPVLAVWALDWRGVKLEVGILVGKFKKVQE